MTTYWLTRFIILRWLGFIYLIAFFAATQQLVPLVGAHGLTPVDLYMPLVRQHFGSRMETFLNFPTLFWLNYSDTALWVVPWIGVVLSLVMVAGYANMPMLAVMWVCYFSIVHVGQEWYGFGWEIQLCETGFLAIFLCAPLDPRPFPAHPVPRPVMWLFLWLIARVMLGSALIKLRGDPCWRDLTALYYFFETQPIPNPFTRFFHFLPHAVLQVGVVLTFFVELICPFFLIGPRVLRYAAGSAMFGFQAILILCGNLSFFNWLTIVPVLACFDDRFWRRCLPGALVRRAEAAQAQAADRNHLVTEIPAWMYVAVVLVLSIQPTLNLLSPNQVMNTSFDTLHLVNAYGAFGSIGRERDVIVFEGTASADAATATDWKEYRTLYLPSDPAAAPVQVAPYQPHLDWMLWFAAMGSPRQYPWTLNMVWKLLHNDPTLLRLLGDNPFPKAPPRFIRVVYYHYHFAPWGNPEHVYWTRERIGLWLPPLSVDDGDLQVFLQDQRWLSPDAGP